MKRNEAKSIKQSEPSELMKLVNQHGMIVIIGALDDLAEHDAGDPNHPSREEAEWFHFQLSHLLEEYFWNFVTPDPLEQGIYQRGVLV
jgi:hypothetical protein